jgi:carboxylate-amine ligase
MEGDRLRATFEDVEPFTVGLEEEVFLLDPDTLGPSDVAPELLDRLGGRPAFKLELPACQLELITAPQATVPEAVAELGAARSRLLAAAEGLARPAATAVHPFGAAEGRLNRGPRYDRAAAEFGPLARRQLVCALQVHVAVGGAERTLAVYNALRGHLPELAALAANGPVYRGRDTGLASVRPKICELLPRQGIPPPLAGWDELASELRWGMTAGAVPAPGFWWWELRPHPRYGTLEVRVPDAQATLADAAAVATVAHALVVDLARRHDAGERPAVPPTWRIAENRWSACRHGVEGQLADLETGERRPTRERLTTLIDRLRPIAEQLGATEPLDHAHSLAVRNGALRQRAVARERGVDGLARWLADRYGDGL